MRSVIIVLGFAILGPASAQEVSAPPMTQAPAHNPLECYCRAQGKMFAMGEKVCLRTAEGPRVAQCRMETNVMSWGVTETPCPET
jgi:hypothetical protein